MKEKEEEGGKMQCFGSNPPLPADKQKGGGQGKPTGLRRLAVGSKRPDSREIQEMSRQAEWEKEIESDQPNMKEEKSNDNNGKEKKEGGMSCKTVTVGGGSIKTQKKNQKDYKPEG